jgi:AhpC/TSA family
MMQEPPMRSDSSANPIAPKTGRDGGAAGFLAAAAIIAALVGMVGILDVAASTTPQIGQPAPDFTALDSKGATVHLSDYRGKTVVLEWTNADCPYTRKHYTSGNMQSVQNLAQQNGIVWLSVISSAPGKQGYVNGAAADALTQARKAAPTSVLLDPTGSIGRLYSAKTTPHMFVIDKNGALQYMGGIDSIASADAGDISRAEPYLKEAMLAVSQGKPAPHAVTKPYGCSIKY